MKPWEVLARTRTLDGTELTLTRHDTEYVIQASGESLMSSRAHASEEALAVVGCRRAQTLAQPCVLVGGLGMGFTLRAALNVLPAGAKVIVAELLPAVVEWNRGPLGPLAQHPLDDPRVTLVEGDVAVTLRQNPGRFDAVLLDVDNGAAAMTATANARLYGRAGLASAHAALAPGGVLAVWLAREDPALEQRLRAAGFRVEREMARAREKKGGRRHAITVAYRGG